LKVTSHQWLSGGASRPSASHWSCTIGPSCSQASKF
jgi:hypothetical protein